MSYSKALLTSCVLGLAAAISIPVATYGQQVVVDGFSSPICPPLATEDSDGDGCYVALDFRELRHLGEDWNGEDGGDTDLGDPVFATANGEVVLARDEGEEWGPTIIIEHELPNGNNVRSLYAHLNEIYVSVGDQVGRGALIGTIGRGYFYGVKNGIEIWDYDVNSACCAHLHFEIRTDETLPRGGGYGTDATGYVDPTDYIENNQSVDPPPPSGSEVRGSFSGAVVRFSTSGDGSIPPGVSVGDPVHGTFSYDPANLLLKRVWGVGGRAHRYQAASATFEVDINGQVWSLNAADIDVLDNFYLASTNEYWDIFRIRRSVYIEDSIVSFPGGYVTDGGYRYMELDIGTGTELLDNLEAPTNIRDLNLASAQRTTGNVQSTNQLGDLWVIWFSIDPQSLTLE